MAGSERLSLEDSWPEDMPDRSTQLDTEWAEIHLCNIKPQRCQGLFVIRAQCNPLCLIYQGPSEWKGLYIGINR